MTFAKMPFPYFGGKSQVAADVWRLLGDCRNYVEPFAGSCAVLLGRPTPIQGPETVNDFSCHLVNALRALKHDPLGMADLCIAPVSEVDTEAQHNQLILRSDDLRNTLGDPEFFDLKLAAWWVKGANEWIGSGWCGGEGPWVWTREAGWSKRNRQLPHLGNAGKGVNRQLPHLRDAGKGVNRKLPHLGDAGKGVNRKLPHLGDAGKGERELRIEALAEWFSTLSDRLCAVRIACGDFERVLGDSVTVKHAGITGVFLDPPYDGTEYVYGTDVPVSQRARDWCIANGNVSKLRIVLAGRADEHDDLLAHGWSKQTWSARRGYSKAANASRHTETLWMSPNCLYSPAKTHEDDFC